MTEAIETAEIFIFNNQEFSKAKPGLIELILDVKKRQIGVEVGTHAGMSADVIAPYFEVLYCVDPYISGYDTSDIASEADRQRCALHVFQHVILPRNPNIHPVYEPSPAAAAGFEDGSLDFVYIDACHRYEAVVADIEAWRPKVRPGGILGGHDYTALFPGVQKAVQERFPKFRYYSGGNWGVRIQPTS